VTDRSRRSAALAALSVLAAVTGCRGKVDAPSLVSLAATPRRGAPPLQVTVAWVVDAGPDEPLQCSVDFGGGAPVQQVSPCPRTGSSAHTYQSLGTFHPQLTVVNQEGAAARASDEVQVQPAVGDLFVAKVEWGQTVFSTTPRLVGQKAALLRLHVLATDGGLGPISVRGRATWDGGSFPLELTGPAPVPLAAVPEDISQSFTAILPPDWVQPGVHVEVRVDADDAVSESDETNNTVSLDPVVGAATLLPLTVVPVVQGGLEPRALLDPWFTTVWRHWPLAALSTTVRAPYTFDGTLDPVDPTEWQALLDQIDALRITDQSTDWYYGYAQVGYLSGLAGLGLVGEPAAIGRDDSERALSHELGHTFNNFHAPCGGAANPDPNYPYPDAQIGVWGWDLVFQRLVNPVTSLDVMSYCSPTWVSDYSYGRAQAHLEAHAPSLAAVARPTTEGLLVHGHVDPDGRVVFQPVQRVRAEASPLAGGAGMRVRVATPDGSLDVVPRLARVADTGALRFSAVVPAVGLVPASVSLLDGARELGRLQRQRHPVPRFLPRAQAVPGGWLVEWDAQATPRLAVTHVGQRRTTLALGLVGGRAFLPTAGLEPGGTLELSASDGVAADLHRLPRP
jgi:hypothetical protein